MRNSFIAVIGLLPASRAKNRLLNLAGRGWSISSSASISPSLLIGLGTVRIGDNASVGFGNVVRRLRCLELGDGAEIMHFNRIFVIGGWINDGAGPDTGTLIIEPEAGLTTWHTLDCTGGIRIGHHSTVGGARSVIFTRGVDIMESTQFIAPVTIGHHCLVMTSVTATAGATIGDKVAVAAGSVVQGSLTEPETLYAGVPAKPVKSLAGGKFFSRDAGRVVPKDLITQRRRHYVGKLRGSVPVPPPRDDRS
jgi:acetyltransferase-like isoleucine patch superfamily enzyme